MTGRDYADMVNPHVRAEEDAYSRGFWDGIRNAIFAIALIAIAAAAFAT